MSASIATVRHMALESLTSAERAMALMSASAVMVWHTVVTFLIRSMFAVELVGATALPTRANSMTGVECAVELIVVSTALELSMAHQEGISAVSVTAMTPASTAAMYLMEVLCMINVASVVDKMYVSIASVSFMAQAGPTNAEHAMALTHVSTALVFRSVADSMTDAESAAVPTLVWTALVYHSAVQWQMHVACAVEEVFLMHAVSAMAIMRAAAVTESATPFSQQRWTDAESVMAAMLVLAVTVFQRSSHSSREPLMPVVCVEALPSTLGSVQEHSRSSSALTVEHWSRKIQHAC